MKKIFLISFLIIILSLARVTFSLEKGHFEAGEQVVKIIFERENIKDRARAYLKKCIKINPQLSDYEDVFCNFFDKYYTYADLKDPLIKLYTDVFTESELKELLAFYNSSLGKKMFEKRAFLNKEQELIGVKIFETHQKELKIMMDERKKNCKGKS